MFCSGEITFEGRQVYLFIFRVFHPDASISSMRYVGSICLSLQRGYSLGVDAALPIPGSSLRQQWTNYACGADEPFNPLTTASR